MMMEDLGASILRVLACVGGVSYQMANAHHRNVQAVPHSSYCPSKAKAEAESLLSHAE